MSRKRGCQHLKHGRRRTLVPRGENPYVHHREEHPDGSSMIALTAKGMELFQEQFDLFREKFGREPEPSDPIFFDPDADEPQPISQGKLRRIVLDGLTTGLGLTPRQAMDHYEYMNSDRYVEDMFVEV